MVRGEFVGQVIPLKNGTGSDIDPYLLISLQTDGTAKLAESEGVVNGTEAVIGVSRYNALLGDEGETPDGEIVDVAISGVVRVMADGDVNAGAPVYLSTENAGKIRGSGDVGVGVSFEDGEAGDVVLVLLNP